MAQTTILLPNCSLSMPAILRVVWDFPAPVWTAQTAMTGFLDLSIV